MVQIYSLPKADGTDSSYQNTEYHFGFYEIKNTRSRQEDALTWQTLSTSDLTPADASAPLTPKEIGHRLWTSYLLLDKRDLHGGTTASTTIYDGNGSLITATLADSAAFAVIYDTNNKPLEVIRLNSVTHTTANMSEVKRISTHSYISYGRVEGSLIPTRSIGDAAYKSAGVCSEATIDITNINVMAKELKINPQPIGKIQVITTCDGFTDGTRSQTKDGHEKYLLRTLKNMRAPGAQSEMELAKQLVDAAKHDGSRDNISVAIQTLTDNAPFLLGVYDGHTGTDASCHAANNIGNIFLKQCSLTPAAYAEQAFSINVKEQSYKRDNQEDVHSKTGRHILDLFKTNSRLFGKKLNIFEDKYKLSGTFFEPTSSAKKEEGSIPPEVSTYPT